MLCRSHFCAREIELRTKTQNRVKIRAWHPARLITSADTRTLNALVADPGDGWPARSIYKFGLEVGAEAELFGDVHPRAQKKGRITRQYRGTGIRMANKNPGKPAGVCYSDC